MPEPIFMKLGMYIIAPEPHLNGVIHKSLLLVCVPICVSPIVATQRLAKNVTVATNTHATLEEFLDSVVLYAISIVSRKVGD
jgi:hypothetical protein